MKVIQDAIAYTIHVKQIKTTRLTVRRQTATEFVVHGPKSMPKNAIETMVQGDFQSLLKLPVPFDYRVYLDRPKIHLFGDIVSAPHTSLKDLLLEEVLQCEAAFKESQSVINLDGLTYNVKYYRSKFGSCHPTRREIRFNQILVHYPKECLSYIYAHEIAHLNEKHHQKSFYALLETIYPNYIAVRKSLKFTHQNMLKGVYDSISIK